MVADLGGLAGLQVVVGLVALGGLVGVRRGGCGRVAFRRVRVGGERVD